MTPLMQKSLSRRTLLRGAGGVGLALPWLSAMEARAQAATEKPKRLVVFYTPNGFSSLPNSMDLTGSPLEPLNRHKSRISLLQGFDLASAKADPTPLDYSHYLGWGHLLTGHSVAAQNVAGGISFDMLLSKRMGSRTPHPYSLHGIPHDQGQSPISWNGAAAAANPEFRPDRAFSKLFAGLNPDSSAQEQATQLKNQKSLLDYVHGSLARMKCSVGSDDAKRLDRHAQNIRDIEQRLGLGAAGGTACRVPAQPGTGLSYVKTAEVQREMLAMAFACDLTRVGSLQFSQVAGGGTPTWLGINGEHHEISHRQDAEGLAQMKKISTWYAEQFALFLDRLTEYTDADGTPIIDNTAVIWVNECGYPAWSHIGTRDKNANMCFVLAGGGGGTLKGGQRIDAAGTPHQNLWVELVNALSPDDVTPIKTFGNPETCTGGFSKIRA